MVFATILGEALPLQSLNEPPPVARGVPYVPIRYEQCGKCKMSNLRTQLVDESQKHRGVEVLTVILVIVILVIVILVIVILVIEILVIVILAIVILVIVILVIVILVI